MIQTVLDLKLGIKEIISINDDQKAIEGFKLMAKLKISAVAVVSHVDGKLLTSLSAKDIRVLEAKVMFTNLFKPCIEFVAASRSVKTASKAKQSSVLSTDESLICCKPTSTLKEVISKLAIMKIHRIFVVDTDKKPLGVISLGDILALFVEQLD